jgi:hypothetical protein
MAIPCSGDTIPIKVMSRLISLDKPKNSKINFTYTTRCFIDKARNGMAYQCLKHKNDYLFFCDSDQIPDKDILIKMLELDKDIIGCPIPNRNGKKELALYDKNGDRIVEFQGTREVGAVGMGSTLIKSQVLKEMFEFYPMPFQFETRINNFDNKEILVEYSEDINFCRRARELAFEVWCIDVVSKHIGEPIEYFYQNGQFLCTQMQKK